MSRRRQALGTTLLAIALLGSSFTRPQIASAHSPHDVVTAIEYRADFRSSGTVFAVVRDRLMRSDDRGEHWREITRGFDRETFGIQTVALSPTDSTVGYAAAESGTVFRTTNGGETWRSVASLDGPIARMDVSTVDPAIVAVYGRRSGLSLSRDSGATWTVDTAAAAKVVDGAFLVDGAFVGLTTEGGIVTTIDAGSNWSSASGPSLGGEPRVVSVVEPPEAGSAMYVATSTGEVFVSRDGGSSFDPASGGLPARHVRSIASSTTEADQTLWMATWAAGPFRSSDRGATWEPITAGTSTNSQASRRREANWNEIAPANDGSGLVLLGGFDGLFALDSTNPDHWRPIETSSEYVSGLAVSPGFVDDGVVMTTSYIRGAFRSSDGGTTWETANDGLVQNDVAPSPFPVPRLHGIVMSPAFVDDRTIFGATWFQMLRSRDGGESWERIALPPSPGRSVRQIVIAVSPAFREDSTVFAGTQQGVLYHSTSGGDHDSWVEVSTLPERIRSVALSPAFEFDDTMFVGTAHGLHVSRDAGRTWTPVEQVADAPPSDADGFGGVQVVVSPTFDTDGAAFAGNSEELYVTSDGGTSWESIESLAGLGPIEAVAVSPQFASDGLLLVSTRRGGLWRSTDGGDTFVPIAAGLADRSLLIADYANPSTNALQFSPTYSTDRTIFAFAQQQVLRSMDAGATWTALELPTSEVVTANLLNHHLLGLRPMTLAAVVAGCVIALGVGAAAARRRLRRS